MHSESRIREAFNRTSAHPADARVRLTADPRDLMAIHHPGVAAVIWVRDTDPAIETALDTLDLSRFSEKAGALNTATTSGEDIPQPVREDAERLMKIFSAVSGGRKLYKPIFSFQNPSGDASDKQDSVASIPHIDGFALRLSVVYSRHPRMGTEWYTALSSALPAIREDFAKTNGSQESDRKKAKRKYGLQQISTNDVVVFKGKPSGGAPSPWPEEEIFLHSAPYPKKRIFRLAFLAGA